MKLSEGNIRYSPSERRAFHAVPQDGTPINTLDIIERVYKENKPFHARQMILGVMTSLANKIDANHEAFMILKTKRAGPNPISFWLEPR
jgi:hypothetical protein